jgi:hypothetical protein
LGFFPAADINATFFDAGGANEDVTILSHRCGANILGAPDSNLTLSILEHPSINLDAQPNDFFYPIQSFDAEDEASLLRAILARGISKKQLGVYFHYLLTDREDKLQSDYVDLNLAKVFLRHTEEFDLAPKSPSIVAMIFDYSRDIPEFLPLLSSVLLHIQSQALFISRTQPTELDAFYRRLLQGSQHSQALRAWLTHEVTLPVEHCIESLSDIKTLNQIPFENLKRELKENGFDLSKSLTEVQNGMSVWQFAINTNNRALLQLHLNIPEFRLNLQVWTAALTQATGSRNLPCTQLLLAAQDKNNIHKKIMEQLSPPLRNTLSDAGMLRIFLQMPHVNENVSDAFLANGMAHAYMNGMPLIGNALLQAIRERTAIYVKEFVKISMADGISPLDESVAEWNNRFMPYLAESIFGNHDILLDRRVWDSILKSAHVHLRKAESYWEAREGIQKKKVLSTPLMHAIFAFLEPATNEHKALCDLEVTHAASNSTDTAMEDVEPERNMGLNFAASSSSMFASSSVPDSKSVYVPANSAKRRRVGT